MKLISLFLAISLFLIFCHFQNSLSVTAQKQSQQTSWCQDQVYGTYWDGQKCEYCYDDNSDCLDKRDYTFKYNQNFGCSSSYAQVQDTATQKKCNQCLYNAATCVFKNYKASAQRSLTCNQNYKLFGHVCANLTNCLVVAENYVCSQCINGYYLDNLVCKLCSVSKCTSCTGPQLCSSCQPSYYLNKTRTSCIPCKDQKYTCSIIDTNYTGCFNYPAEYFSSNQCYKCNVVIPNCVTCTNSSTSLLNCITCETLYETLYNLTTKQTVCVKSLSNCYKVNASYTSQCQIGQCKKNYYLDSNYQCQSCDTYFNVERCTSTSNALFCKQPQLGRQKVNSINQNYYLVSGSCILNSYFCKTMDNNKGKCTSCYYDQFHYMYTDNTCRICPADTKIKCLSIKTTPTQSCECTQCFSNYYLDSGSCLQCMVGCAQCNIGSQCIQCQSGYYLNKTQDKKCYRCDDTNCSICDSATNQCTTCRAEYQLYYVNKIKTCLKCVPGCQTCDPNTRQRCLQCSYPYYLYNGVCLAGRDYCSTYNGDGSCIDCNYGYRNVGGWCVPCMFPLYQDAQGKWYSLGYVNCERQASGKYYVRDGDTLTESFENSKNYPRSSQNILQIYLGLLAFIVALMQLI